MILNIFYLSMLVFVFGAGMHWNKQSFWRGGVLSLGNEQALLILAGFLAVPYDGDRVFNMAVRVASVIL